jgi:hypothetical protein
MTRRLIINVFIALVSILFFTAYARAAGFLDYPHKYDGCSNCHLGHHSGEPSLLPPYNCTTIDETQHNNLCESCHDSITAPFVKTHSSLQTDNGYGDWSVECRTCHYPHKQMQFREYGSDSHLYSEQSDDIQLDTPAAGQSRLTDNEASWTPDEYVGYVLIANINDSTTGFRGFGYEILNNTATTMTVDGNIDLTKAPIGSTFAIIYGNIIRELVTLDDIIRYCSQSTSIPDQFTLTEAGAGWTIDQFAGLKLIPNIVHSDNRHTIESNTSDTITVVNTETMDLGKIEVGRDFKVVGLKTGTKSVKFFNNTGTNSFADGDTTYDGICEVCHTQTDHFRNDGTGPDQDHTSQGPSIPGSNCTTCHSHVEGFKGVGGDCVECHDTSGPGINVQTEFGTTILDVNSHHISKAWADMGGEDCVACHGEGDPNGDGTASQSALHPSGSADGTVEMIDNSDINRNTIISITLRGGSGLEDKNNAESTDLDTFCMGCHRAGGAAAVTSNDNCVGAGIPYACCTGVGAGTCSGFDANHEPTNPFGETTNIRTNQYDTTQKNFTIDGGGLAIYDAFDPGPGSGTDSDSDNERENHHAVRTARYTGTLLRTGGLLSATVALWDGTTGVSDNDTLHCADCHSVAFSAHGSANEYFLQRLAGGTVLEENPTDEHQDVSEYVCYKCHTGNYSDAAAHSSSGSNFAHTAAEDTLANRTSSDGHGTGIACFNCHDGAVGWGGVHGFSDATYLAGDWDNQGNDGTYNKRRFLPGSSQQYYSPGSSTGANAETNDADWQGPTTGNGSTCYTIDSAVTMSGCTKHNKTGGESWGNRQIQRNVDY